VFPGYQSSDIGLSAVLSNTGEDVNKIFTTVSSGNVFCAFLVKVNSSDNEYFLHLSGTPIGTNYKGRVIANGTGNSFNFGLSKGSENAVLTTGSPYTAGVTYLLVLKYSITAGASNDEVSLFIITVSVPATEPSVPTIGPLADAGQTDLTNVSAVVLRQNSSAQNILVDGIRVASKWADAVGVLTGKEDPSMSDNPVLYPVPVKDELIACNILDVNMIEIFDLTGRKLISVKTEFADIIRIPVSHLSHGLFIVRLYTTGGTKIMKFIKI
jgi:hypothetical protein